MQCQSYFPSYNSYYDLNVDNSGGVRPIYNGNGIFRSGHYNNYVSTLPVAEVLRQTILMHEGTFREQVQELHRLYKRQKELMGEIRNKELYMNHLHLGPQCSGSFLAKFGQNTIIPENGGTLNVPDQEYKGKKIGRKFLDLELPAEEYIDLEEGGCSENSQFPQDPSLTCPSNMSSKVVVETAPMASGANMWLDPILQRGSPSPNLFAQTKTNFADLNEPLTTFDLEDRVLEGKDSGPEVSGRNHDLLNKGNRRFEGASNGAHSEVHPASDSRQYLNGSNRFDLNSAVVEESEFTPSDTSISQGFKEVNLDHWKDVLPLSCEDAVSPRRSTKTRLFDINLPCDPTIEEDQAIIENDVIGHNDKKPGQINLNVSMNDDRLHQKSCLEKTSLEIDLEAPLSPEVEERPPPRGDSEETQSEELATLEVGSDTLEELLKNAAEAIVSMSSSKPQLCPEKCEPSDTTTLEWFAGLVHSISSDVEPDFRTPSCGDANVLDEFEVLTLNLTEMKVEEYWCEKNVQIEDSSCSMPVPGQTRKGRTRRSKRKDFQREVLPSLASLSRYEVTEDIQMIEGLMEAAGTPWHLSRGRRACRMGRKPRTTKVDCPTFEKLTSESKGGAFMGWGKANRRPRGRRSPASPSTVLSKWLEM